MHTSLLIIASIAALADQPASQPEQHAAVPAARAIAAAFEPLKLYVKFHDDLPVRLGPDGRTLSDRGTGVLGAAAADLAKLGGTWTRVHEIDEAVLDRLRATATKNLGRGTPDHSTEFYLTLPAGASIDDAKAALDAMAVVHATGRVPLPVVAPAAPDFTPNQGYLRNAGLGHGSEALWTWPGGRGEGVRVCDLEYSWNLSHVDLPTVTRIGPAGTDPFNSTHHGTAVLGAMLARDDGAGTTGMCHDATGYVVPVYRNSTWDIGAAIITALTTLEAGDVLLIEQQVQGPNWPGAGQVGLVPCDWILGWYNAVVTATGNGITVIEAAGNGSENLDDPVYATGNGGHWPFLPENDSGAIIIGGGLTPTHLDQDRTRSGSSNYGSAVELQSWSTRVATLGYGTLYSAEGTNVLYASSFSGTSSATAVVGGAAAQLQALHKAVRGTPLTPAAVRDVLQATGLPQQSGTFPASQTIGPRPNLVGAAFHLLDGVDCDNNGVPDEIDILASPLLDGDANGGIDSCERPCERRVSLIHNAPALVPDADSIGLESSLDSPALEGQVVSLDVWVELTHLYAGDVTLTLSNGDRTVSLVARIGRESSGDGDASDFDGRYVFSDTAAADIWAAAAASGTTSPIAPGTYIPTGQWTSGGPAQTSLRDFAGANPGDTWTLTVTDEKVTDPGTLIRWGIVLTVRTPDCCVADFDDDGAVAVPDIFAYLSAWFEGRASADIDLDGVAGVPDIFAFLSVWFQGCS